jgi:hypothetical protein
MIWIGVVVVFVVVQWIVRRMIKAQSEAIGDAMAEQVERTNDAHKEIVSLLLDRTPGGLYEAWEAGTRALMRRGLSFAAAKLLTEQVIRKRIGADPYEYEEALFKLEPRLEATFGQPEPSSRR